MQPALPPQSGPPTTPCAHGPGAVAALVPERQPWVAAARGRLRAGARLGFCCSQPHQSVLQPGVAAAPVTLMPADSSGIAGSRARIYLPVQPSSPARRQNAISRKPGCSGAGGTLGMAAAALRHSGSSLTRYPQQHRRLCQEPTVAACPCWEAPGFPAGVSDVASLVAPLGTGRCWCRLTDSSGFGQGEAGSAGPPGLASSDPLSVCLAQVNVTVDYIRPASSATETVPAFSERTCATVSIGGM